MALLGVGQSKGRHRSPAEGQALVWGAPDPPDGDTGAPGGWDAKPRSALSCACSRKPDALPGPPL